MSSLGRVLVKVAVSKGRLSQAQTRQGRRPMSVDTLLRKDREGTLYKAATLLPQPVLNAEAGISDTLGLNVRNLLQRRTLGTELLGKVQHELLDTAGLGTQLSHTLGIPKVGFDKSALAREVASVHKQEHPERYAVLEKTAYTVAELGLLSTLVGAGTGAASDGVRGAAVGGALLGTGLGLESGTAVGRALDKRAK